MSSGGGKAVGEACSWNWQCNNQLCGRPHATNNKECCDTESLCTNFGLDFCSGYSAGEDCAHDCQCAENHVCDSGKCTVNNGIIRGTYLKIALDGEKVTQTVQLECNFFSPPSGSASYAFIQLIKIIDGKEIDYLRGTRGITFDPKSTYPYNVAKPGKFTYTEVFDQLVLDGIVLADYTHVRMVIVDEKAQGNQFGPYVKLDYHPEIFAQCNLAERTIQVDVDGDIPGNEKVCVYNFNDPNTECKNFNYDNPKCCQDYSENITWNVNLEKPFYVQFKNKDKDSNMALVDCTINPSSLDYLV